MSDKPTRPSVIDIHCHFSLIRRRWEDASPFAFERDSPRPLASYVSDRLLNRLVWRLARRFVGLGRATDRNELDARWERFQLEHLTEVRRVDRMVVLAMDEVHANTGEARGPTGRRGDFGTDLYTANGLVHRLCGRYPDRFLFGASIHPYRRWRGGDAIDLLGEVADAGAVLIKWLPPVHNIDAGDLRTVAFLRRCAELRMPLLVHYGAEFSLGTNNRQATDPGPMLDALRRLRQEGSMPTVIVTHLATPVLWPFTSGGHFRKLVDALTGEFAAAPLYADISALGSPSKAHWLRKILDMPSLWPKLVHGSDFPIPIVPLLFRRRLGRRYKEVVGQKSWIDRDYLLKRSLGLPEEVFTRAHTLLRIPKAAGAAGSKLSV